AADVAFFPRASLLAVSRSLNFSNRSTASRFLWTSISPSAIPLTPFELLTLGECRQYKLTIFSEGGAHEALPRRAGRCASACCDRGSRHRRSAHRSRSEQTLSDHAGGGPLGHLCG